MDNNDRLIRIRYALNINDEEMMEIFKLGDMDFSKNDVSMLLTKSKDRYFDKEGNWIRKEDAEDNIACSSNIFESFLNGLIISRRGVPEYKEGQKIPPKYIIKLKGDSNSVMLKKLKIALSLTADDVLDIGSLGGESISKSQLGAFLRNSSHAKYLACGDKYARHFLKGLAMKYKK